MVKNFVLKMYYYLPTNKKDSEYNYRECLDVLRDIICRFGFIN